MAERSLFTVLFHVRHVAGFADKSKGKAHNILVRNPKEKRQLNKRTLIYGHKFMTQLTGVVT
jgi:hypothetical protein